MDWGDEGGVLADVGIAKVYLFHMVLSYSRDPDKTQIVYCMDANRSHRFERSAFTFLGYTFRRRCP